MAISQEHTHLLFVSMSTINIYTRIAFREFFEWIFPWENCWIGNVYRADSSLALFFAFACTNLSIIILNPHLWNCVHRFIYLDYDASRQTVCKNIERMGDEDTHSNDTKGCKTQSEYEFKAKSSASICSKIHKMNWNGNKSVWWYTQHSQSSRRVWEWA